jgi:hypothetical protein
MMNSADDTANDRDPSGPMTLAKLAVLFVAIWLACGFLATLVHLACAPGYIDTPTRLAGGAANLFGPWARPLVDQWPNGGKAPHKPSAFIGLVVLTLMGVVIFLCTTASTRTTQTICLVTFGLFMVVWIGVGFLELMVCAA